MRSAIPEQFPQPNLLREMRCFKLRKRFLLLKKAALSSFSFSQTRKTWHRNRGIEIALKQEKARTKSGCSDNVQSHKQNDVPILKRTRDMYVHIREKLLSSAKPGRSYDGAVVTRTVTEPKESGE